jgi:DNA-binding response OmpR family regulator
MKTALSAQSCDAIVLNGKMPGSSSVQETRKWIAETWPELGSHLMFTFSSLAEPEVRSFLEQNEVQFLVKPFEIGDLIAAARKLLEKPRAAAAKSSG